LRTMGGGVFSHKLLIKSVQFFKYSHFNYTFYSLSFGSTARPLRHTVKNI
jgi:hypothetical protein